MNNNKTIEVLNKIYSAHIEDHEFINPDTNKPITYSTLELGLRISGEKQQISIKLPAKTNAKLLILASKEKTENLFDESDENM